MTGPAVEVSTPRLHDPTRLGRFLFGAGRFVFFLLFRAIWRMRVVGRENVPRAESVLFASNHASWADPPIVGCTSPRTIHFMAKQELFDVPLFGWLIRQVNAFPLRRADRDVGAFRTAQKILNAGGALIIFPEGTRQRTGALGKAKAGVGMLSSKTGSAVVPVYIHNSHRLRSLARLGVSFGSPVYPGTETDYQAFSNRIMAAIASLKEAYSGTYD